MNWPFKDYDFYGDRYVNIQDPTTLEEIMWYERNIDKDTTPTECLICIEAEQENYTKYAHPKAHLEAHAQATTSAEALSIKEKHTEDYIEYYIFYYGREYKKIYKELYNKYKKEYSEIVLSRSYDKNDKICQHHSESLQYYYQMK